MSCWIPHVKQRARRVLFTKAAGPIPCSRDHWHCWWRGLRIGCAEVSGENLRWHESQARDAIRRGDSRRRDGPFPFVGTQSFLCSTPVEKSASRVAHVER